LRFCSNPTDLPTPGPELGTKGWIRVLREARALGAVQPRGFGRGAAGARGPRAIVAQAATLGFYINLITSGIGMTRRACARWKAAGLITSKLSFQDSTRELNVS